METGKLVVLGMTGKTGITDMCTYFRFKRMRVDNRKAISGTGRDKKLYTLLSGGSYRRYSQGYAP